jgi:hypothetical protein
MNKLLLFYIFICFWISSFSQLTPYKEEFSKLQTKQWIINNLDKSILYENDSQVKPKFSINDTAIQLELKNYASLGSMPYSLNYIIRIKSLDYIMNMFIDREQFIVFPREKASSIYLKINTRFLKEDQTASFVKHLNDALSKLK